jgi:hypothetical protein
MSKPPTEIPDEISAEVLFQHHRTCCVCHEPGKAIQIHHIDEDPTNHTISNLAVLCLEHHDQTQRRGGFAKKLKAADVERSRDDWIHRVRVRREKTDELAIQRMAGGRDEAQQGTNNQSRTAHSLRIIVGNGKPFERVDVNEHGEHRTLFLGVKNVGASKVSNCCFYRTYISSLNDKQKRFWKMRFPSIPTKSDMSRLLCSMRRKSFRTPLI